MAEVTLTPDYVWSQRSRTETSWTNAVTGADTVFSAIPNFHTQTDRATHDGGTAFTCDRSYLNFSLSVLPSYHTITAVDLVLHGISDGVVDDDSEFLERKIVKATEPDLTTGAASPATWPERDESITHGDYVTWNTDADNTFSFGTDLLNYVKVQHSSGLRCAFWLMNQLELEDDTYTPSGGANATSWAGYAHVGAESEKPRLVITYTVGSPQIQSKNIQIGSGQLNIKGGTLTIK